MLQEVMTSPGVIEFRDVPIPEIRDDQVLVKMMRLGICGSDIHVYHGKHPYTKYPVTQGLEVGQKVVLEPQVTCGKCYPCTHGKYNLCTELKVMGFQTTGAASEYFAVDASKVDVIPDSMTYDEAALIEPLAVTVHAAKRFQDINGANVSIIGCGPIGILLMQSCKALGAAKVLITDISDYRLELAKSLGADYAINTAKVPYADAIAEVFGPDKADVTYECAGNNATTDMAIQNSRKGSVIVLVAVFADWAKVDLARLNDSELTLDTSMMYRHEDYVDALRFVAEGKIQLKPLISKHFAFRDFLSAYQYIDANRERTMKVVVDIQD